MTTEPEPTKPPKPMTAGELRKAAQERSKLAIETLEAIMGGGGQDSVKLAAAREVLDRAHGRTDARARKVKPQKAPAKAAGMTVIVKRFSDVTPEEQAAADATERDEW